MLKERIVKIYFYRHALWKMALSQLKAKYSGSVLGISWAIINPLLVMLALTFVFVVVFKIEIKNFPLFALSGIFPWMFFSNALSEATGSVISQQSILRQFNLPREIIPLSSVLSNFLNFLIGWIIIYPLFLLYNPKIILLLPLLLFILLLNLMFTWGLSLIFSVGNVFIRDISQLLGVILMIWFWITPIFYSVDMVPLRLRWVCDFNPLAPFIIYYRDILLLRNIPSITIFLKAIVFTFISLVLGLIIFSSNESKLLKRI